MEVKGPFPVKMLRKHRSGFERLAKEHHFVEMPDWRFRSVEIDKVSRREMVKYIVFKNKTRDIGKILLGAAGNDKGERQNAMLLKDLLERLFTLDPDKRIIPSDCLKHPFISESARAKKNAAHQARSS